MTSTRRAASILFITAAAIALFVAPGGAADSQEVAEVDRTAYFTRPITAATPPLLTEGFPPSTVCLVAGLVGFPQACGPEVTDVTDSLGLSDGAPVPETIDADLAQPVLPGTLPVGMAAGQERYSSVIQFELPAVPDGEEFGSFQLLLYPDGLSYAAESPAFRDAVEAAISQVRDQDPQAFVDVLSDVLEGETAAIAESITGIEACPATDTWDAGPAQNAGPDGERMPRSDCLIGTTGAFDTDLGAWVFDLTFAAQAWTTGGLSGEPIPNQGVVFRPLGAENLAYGDPDMSTNWLESLAGPDNEDGDLHPRIRYSFVPALGSFEPLLPEVTVPESPSFTPSAPTPAPAPSVTPTPAAPSQPQDPVVQTPGIRARYVEPASVSGDSSTPWWVVLVLPLGLAGAWALGEGLFAGPALATRRDGALQHLVENNPSGSS